MENWKGGGKSSKLTGGLTALQRRFCEEYIKDYNGGRAYSEVSSTVRDALQARHQANKLLKKPEVLEYIRVLQEQAVKEAGISAAKVIKEIDRIAFDPATSESGRLKALDLLQKQLGVQQQKVDAKVETTITVGYDEP